MTAKQCEMSPLGSQQGQQEWGQALQRGPKTEAKDNGSYGWLHPNHPHFCQTMDSRVIGAQCQLHHQCPQCLRGQEDPGIHVMADIPTGNQETIWKSIFKDDNTKDAVTYQIWCWDLTVYHCVGCWDCTLLPYAIHLLQGYPGELVWSLGMDITLDNVLTILDKHYSNVKSLDVLNQELLQLHMGEKETVSDWGVLLSRHLQILPASFPECFPPDCFAELKHDHFYGRLPKWLKAMVAYLKASANEKTYSIFKQLGKWRRRRQWKLLTVKPLTHQVSPRLQVSFLYKSWRVPSLPRSWL